MFQRPVKNWKPGRHTDLALRAAGAVLLAPVFGLVAILYGRMHATRPPVCGPVEFTVALAAMALLWMALVLIFAGDSLLRPMPRPPRPLQ